MKIKKKTGALMLTAAVAAITGVSAVSYAAWAGSNDTLTALAATGEAYLFGFTEDRSGANMELGTLVPYDQPANTIKTGVTYVSVVLPEYAVNADYTVTVKSETALNFYVLVGEQQTAAPTKEALTAANSEWKKVNSAGVTFEFTATTGTTVTDKYLSIVLDSTDTAEMGQSDVGFTVTLAEKTTA